jgi:3',5'-nucleoside bisphosphate phosphatase
MHTKGKITAAISLIFLTATLQLAGQRNDLSMPDISGYVTLKCDFHSHTVFSDGEAWPDVRVEEAWRDGLDAIAITDHIEYTPHKGYIPVKLNAAWEIAQKSAADRNILLVHGAEITRDMPPGHLNALFIQDANLLAVPDFMKSIEAAVIQGAFIQYNHPGWKSQEPDGIPKLYSIHKELIAKGWLHGIEYFNEFEHYPLVLDMCREYNLAVMGNSDIHGAISESYKRPDYSQRPVTLVFAKERTLESLREAMFAGRTAVWYGNELAGFKEYTEPLFYASLTVSKPYMSNDKFIFFEITNQSDLPFYLINGPEGAPKEINIPARSSMIVRAVLKYAAEPLKYDVRNIITGNGQILNIIISVPGK